MNLRQAFLLVTAIGLIPVALTYGLQPEVMQAALFSLVVFMLGLAAGRTLSLVVDGMPHWLLVVYLAVELGLGMVGLALLRKPD